jgi:hypothetical protein
MTERTTPTTFHNRGLTPLVVAPLFRTKRVHKVLMDGGSGPNIIYMSTLDSIGIH